MTDYTDLAKRAVACKRWRWMPGMLTTDGLRVAHNGDQLVGISHDYKRNEWCELGLNGRLPDLDDPATLGCLLALVREAWDDQGLHCAGRYGSGEWLWHVQGGKPHGASFRRHVYAIGHGTEAEALVAALKAAPC